MCEDSNFTGQQYILMMLRSVAQYQETLTIRKCNKAGLIQE